MILHLNVIHWDFPGSPVVKTLCFQCRGYRFNPWFGETKIPHAARHSQEIFLKKFKKYIKTQSRASLVA